MGTRLLLLVFISGTGFAQSSASNTKIFEPVTYMGSDIVYAATSQERKEITSDKDFNALMQTRADEFCVLNNYKKASKYKVDTTSNSQVKGRCPGTAGTMAEIAPVIKLVDGAFAAMVGAIAIPPYYANRIFTSISCSH